MNFALPTHAMTARLQLSERRYAAEMAEERRVRALGPIPLDSEDYVDFMQGLRDVLGDVKPVDRSFDIAISKPPKGKVNVYFTQDVSEALFEQIVRFRLLQDQDYRKIGRAKGFMYGVMSEMTIIDAAECREKHGYVLAVSSAGRELIIDKERLMSSSVVSTILADINECAVCFKDHPMTNSSCEVCNKFVCRDCAVQMEVCPFCRGDPRWNRGLS
eukprot:3742855-Rhodomonas_salina.1